MTTTSGGAPDAAPALDLVAVLADLQTQLSDLRRAVDDQQATIDALSDLVIDLLKARDADP